MIALAYACLGLLVGVIAGLTSSPISLTLLAALFTFVGGTGAYFLQLKPSERKLLSVVILSFSGFCLIGLLSGIYVKVNRLLDPSATAPTVTNPTGKPSTGEKPEYFKSGMLGKLDLINHQYLQKQLSPTEAYEQTWAEIQNDRMRD